jgi:hypothetical protein
MKGPDFLSRLRATLDIPGLDLNTDFDPYGPIEAFPCEAAILLRRACILAHQLADKAPHLRDSSQVLRISPTVLRALLHLPQFVHGNRSFEALLDMSQLTGARTFTPSLLPADDHTGLHANPAHLGQLLSTDYPFPPADRELIAEAIHSAYARQRRKDPQHRPDEPALKPWSDLPGEFKESNRQQADDIAVKLRAVGLWFRRMIPGGQGISDPKALDRRIEMLARAEHDRWVAEKRRNGWIPAPGKSRADRNDRLRLHNFLFPWDELDSETQDLDRDTVRKIPEFLAAAGYEIIEG